MRYACKAADNEAPTAVTSFPYEEFGAILKQVIGRTRPEIKTASVRLGISAITLEAIVNGRGQGNISADTVKKKNWLGVLEEYYADSDEDSYSRVIELLKRMPPKAQRNSAPKAASKAAGKKPLTPKEKAAKWIKDVVAAHGGVDGPEELAKTAQLLDAPHALRKPEIWRGLLAGKENWPDTFFWQAIILTEQGYFIPVSNGSRSFYQRARELKQHFAPGKTHWAL